MDKPIGVFDSGLGGLTVLREIERVLPQEDLIYLGDTARVPYGVKSAETVTRYSQEICDFLLRQEVKAIVVACNTASALALAKLQSCYPVPLLGVLEPGVEAAVKASRHRAIGVIGTEGTIKSESYPKAILSRCPEARVLSRACPLFVPLVEEGWLAHEITRRIAEIYLESWSHGEIDTLILGCTHYPLLKTVLQEVLGSKVRLVDSASETAASLKAMLQAQALVTRRPGPGTHRYFSTDAPEKMRELASRFLGHMPGRVEFTDLVSS
jgi:glutamate racemase